MGANRIRLRQWALVVIVTATAVLLLAACGSQSTTSTVAPAKNAAPPPPHEGDGESIAEFLAGLAKDPAKNFVMDQLGIPTTESQLRVLSEKIDALRAQLTATEARLSAQIAELSLQGRLDYLSDQATNLKSMYVDYLVPLVSSLINVKAAQEATPRDQAKIDAAIADYNTHKSEFLSFANSIKVTTLAEKFHNRIQPRDGDGVLRQYGTLIMVKHRIVNLGDTQRVATLYRYLEDNQALAAWMTVERAIAVGGTSKDTIKRTLDEFFAWQKDQTDPNKPNALLPQIPAGVVIDRGPDASAPSYSTAGRPMFTYVNGVYAYAPWADQAWKPPVPRTVPAAVQNAHNTKLKGFYGWGVPSEGQVYGLFSGVTSRTPEGITAYINTIFGNIPIPRPWVWDSDTNDQTYCYYDAKHRDHCTKRKAYRGVSTDNLDSAPHPRYSGFVNLEEQYRGAQGGLFLVRKTGDLENYL